MKLQYTMNDYKDVMIHTFWKHTTWVFFQRMNQSFLGCMKVDISLVQITIPERQSDLINEVALQRFAYHHCNKNTLILLLR